MKKLTTLIIGLAFAFATYVQAQPEDKKKKQSKQAPAQAQAQPQRQQAPKQQHAQKQQRAQAPQANTQAQRQQPAANANADRMQKSKGPKHERTAPTSAESNRTPPGQVNKQQQQQAQADASQKKQERMQQQQQQQQQAQQNAQQQAQSKKQQRQQQQQELQQAQQNAQQQAQSKKNQKMNAPQQNQPNVAQQAQTNQPAKARPNPETVQRIKSQHTNFQAQPKTNIASVQFNEGHRIRGADTWQGSQYQVFRSYRPQWHDRSWWHSHHDNIVLIAGGWYFWNSGYWYPAWGYDASASYYPYDGPIYVGSSARRLDRTVADVQALLQEQGYYRGEVDGLVGPMTQDALAAYQQDQGLVVTSTIDEPTLDSLGLT